MDYNILLLDNQRINEILSFWGKINGLGIGYSDSKEKILEHLKKIQVQTLWQL